MLQDQVEKVFQKQLSMDDMFEKRRVSLKKLAAKQTRPVQPVAPRPEAIIKSPMSSPGVLPHQLPFIFFFLVLFFSKISILFINVGSLNLYFAQSSQGPLLLFV